MDDVQHLRDLAEWYRAFAELAGNAEERQRRRAHADYLERLAREQGQEGDPENRH